MATRTAARPPLLPLLAAVPVSILLVLAGIWLAGGVLTNDFRASMGLTAVWFLVVLVAAALAWRRGPTFRPAAIAGLATFAVVGALLALGTFRDVTVNERVAVGPAALSGRFAAGAHPTVGTAALVAAGDDTVLTLTDFRTSAGPDLFVYVVPAGTTDSVTGGLRLGRLKGNIGNQQYTLPAGFDLQPGASVVIWCRSFTVAFGAALLRAG
jgi:hypothetical protein